MLRVTAEAFQGEVESAQEAIVLAGPPHRLRGYLSLSNRTAETVLVRSLPLAYEKELGLEPGLGEGLRLTARLGAGETQTRRLMVALPAQTPPGSFETRVKIGEQEKTLRVVVKPCLAIDLVPDRLCLTGIAPGLVHEEELLLHNRGNIPLLVPRLLHHTTLDADLVCRNLSFAFRDRERAGIEATLDAFVDGVKREIAGWVETEVKEAGQVIPPGETLLVHLSLKLPEDVRAEREYRGFIRIFNRTLSYTIVAAPPAERPVVRARRRRTL